MKNYNDFRHTLWAVIPNEDQIEFIEEVRFIAESDSFGQMVILMEECHKVANENEYFILDTKKHKIVCTTPNLQRRYNFY